MEPLRDTTYNLHIFGIRVNMVLAIAIAVFAIAALIVLYIRKPARFVRVKKEPESRKSAYEKQFSYAVDEQELNEEEEDQKDG